MTKWSEIKREWEKDPDFVAEYARYRRRLDRADRLTKPLRHVPVVGQLIQSFWFGILVEGVRDTCQPRWGLLTFSFLNDGFKPSVWHTWQQITRPHDHPYTGIWVTGAPRNAKEAGGDA
jgi:hypothetical protein